VTGSPTGWLAAQGSQRPCRTTGRGTGSWRPHQNRPVPRGGSATCRSAPGRRRRPGEPHRPVVFLDLGPERLRVSRPCPPARADRHGSFGSQDRGGLRVANARVDPVQRVEHRHRADRGGIGVLPVLERGRNHADAGEPRRPNTRHVRQCRAQLDRSDPKPALGQWHRRLPGPAANLDNPVTPPETGRLDQVVKQDIRKHRPGPVISVGISVEPATQRTSRAVPWHRRTRCLAHELRTRPSTTPVQQDYRDPRRTGISGRQRSSRGRTR
jgi:hypothetical protein